MEEEDIDKSDTEVINECERELEELSREKRRRESGESSEEGFITVVRRNPKRLIRSTSVNSITEKSMETQETMNESGADEVEVCLFSKQVLPKQMAFARLLRNEGITNICKIKYKSAYRLFVLFNAKDQAQKLLECQKLVELDIRAQFTDHSRLSYGIIRGVDIEMSENEILENLSASCEIVSVKRMKRMNIENKWVDSETVRLCFKSASIPRAIEAYGIKFRVEKYVFPVTQCSMCWKFGHIRKFCSQNKIICPKCSGEHGNCETENYKCVNCKGPHMALHKTCPLFIKEKEIRCLMSEKEITYKKALELFLQTKEAQLNKTLTDFLTPTLNAHTTPSKIMEPNPKKTYSQIVQASIENQEEEQPLASENTSTRARKKKRKSKGNDTEISGFNVPMESEQIEVERENLEMRSEVIAEESEKRRERKFDIFNLLLKLKSIILARNSWENKVFLIIKVIVEECKTCLYSLFAGGDLVERVFKLFDG